MNNKHIGSLIKQRRVVLRINQRELSGISGIAIHTLSNIEAGKSNPTIATLDRVLKAIGMEIRIHLKNC